MTEPEEKQKPKLWPFSFWSYGLYQQCPKSFELTIIKRLRVSQFIHNRATLLGALVHNTMEMALKVKDFKHQWVTCLERTAIALAKRADPKEIDKLKKRATTAINWIVEKNLRPFFDECELVAEWTFKVPFEPAGVILKGRIDLVIVEADQCRIYDYKGVGKMERMKPDQLWFYAQGVIHEWKKPLKEAAFLWFTKEMVKPYSVPRLDEIMTSKLKEMKAGVEQEKFPAKIGRHCTWCDVKDHCDAYKEFVNAAG